MSSERRATLAPGSFDDLLELASLQAKLKSVLSASPDDQVVVGVSQAGIAAIASVGSLLPDAEQVGVGCTTKLLTAALLMELVNGGVVSLDDSFAVHAGGALPGVSFRHLLEHTHGIDDSGLFSAPRTAEARIDFHVLVRDLESRARLSSPGALYSYSNAGAWLIASFLERYYDAPYASLLNERLLRQLTPDVKPSLQSSCPASGAELHLHAGALLAFARACFDDSRSKPSWTFLPLPDAMTPYPGWSPLERGVCLGWKHCGEGWFGHQSVFPSGLNFVRVHPASGVAIVVGSNRRMPATIASAIFGSLLPEFTSYSHPHPLGAHEVDYSYLHSCVATYERQDVVVRVRPGRARLLELEAYARDDTGSADEPFFSTLLLPASGRAFYASPKGHQDFQVMQFVPGSADRPSHLWNTRYLLRRRDAAID